MLLTDASKYDLNIDNMALMKRQDKNIFLDWEIVMRDTDKSENVLLFENGYGQEVWKRQRHYMLSNLLQKIKFNLWTYLLSYKCSQVKDNSK